VNLTLTWTTRAYNRSRIPPTWSLFAQDRTVLWEVFYGVRPLRLSTDYPPHLWTEPLPAPHHWMHQSDPVIQSAQLWHQRYESTLYGVHIETPADQSSLSDPRLRELLRRVTRAANRPSGTFQLDLETP
jgi:hypothetical protein